jgi:hypothetical protein
MPPRLQEVTRLISREAPPADQLDPAERQALKDEGSRLSLDEALEMARSLGRDATGDAIATASTLLEQK